jgi:hypothetical protein
MIIIKNIQCILLTTQEKTSYFPNHKGFCLFVKYNLQHPAYRCWNEDDQIRMLLYVLEGFYLD